MSFIDTLAQKKILSATELSAIQKELADGSTEGVDALLIKHGVDDEKLLALKGEFYNLPIKKLDGKQIPFDVLQYIPEESVRYYKFVPIAVKDGVLEVGMLDPDNIEARDALQFISSKVNFPFKIYLVSVKDFESVLTVYKNLSGEVTKALSELEVELSGDTKAIDDDGTNSEDISSTQDKAGITIIEEAPVTKIVATILRYAIEGRASDVHIEHMGEKVRVRFRVDGTLSTSLILPTKVHSQVVARIKILCNMKLDERRKPQDGRFSARIEGRKIDFRVSTFPAYYGEKVVMRILDAERGVISIDKMGFSKEHMTMVREAMKRPYGLILIAGPTGSGKSTTLYSMLNEVDMESKNVLSLEDPVEFNIPGMNQSQVHPEIGYTFASGLRTTLRQDPNIIMVGEIRDKETAELAIQAALTGHLVLSTIHTNSAVGVIPRLVDMGVEPYLIAPTLILTIAQRLVKVLCPGGGKPIPVEGALKIRFEKQFEDLPDEFRKKIVIGENVYEASPTDDCPSGTRGRMGVFELFKMDKEIEAAILKDSSEPNIFKMLRNRGMLTMREDGILKALDRQIPFEEINTL
jgi:type IV pilus assembly protein PilB